MKYLVAHRSIKAREGLKKAFEQNAKATVMVCETGAQALKILGDQSFDLIVLDSKLKKVDGNSICQKLRNLKVFTPIVMIAGSRKERIEALASGADVSPPLPLNLDELRAEINSLIRRHTLYRRQLSSIKVGDFLFDQQKLRLFHKNKEVFLSNMESKLFEYMALHKEEILTREILCKKVWGINHGSQSNSVDVYIAHLRKKIDKPYGTQHIRSLRGRGYMMTERQASTAQKPL